MSLAPSPAMGRAISCRARFAPDVLDHGISGGSEPSATIP